MDVVRGANRGWQFVRTATPDSWVSLNHRLDAHRVSYSFRRFLPVVYTPAPNRMSASPPSRVIATD